MQNILTGLLPQQIEFYNRHAGRLALALKEASEFEHYFETVDIYINGQHYETLEDSDEADDMFVDKYVDEQVENGVTDIVALDYYGSVIYPIFNTFSDIQQHMDHHDTPSQIRYQGLDLLNVMLPYHLFRELEDRLNGNIINENESKELCILSLSASAIKDGEWNVGDGEEDNEEELVEQLEELMIWLRWKVQTLPQVNEIRIAVWN